MSFCPDGEVVARADVRVYPICCTSMYCGDSGDACRGCRNEPELLAFKRWEAEQAAICSDSIWSPLVYRSTR